MTNAEWLIKNEIPFKNINIHIDIIKMIANVYVEGYEKIIYNLEPDDPNDETQEEFANTFSVLDFFEAWLDNEVNEQLFRKKFLNKKEKNWLVNFIKPFYQKIDHLIDIKVMRHLIGHIKDDSVENDLNCIQISYTNRIFDSDGNPNSTEIFRQTIELPRGSDICVNMVADKEYSVTELNLGFDFHFES